MPRGGAITFGDLDGKTDVLRVACRKCERNGHYHVAGLIERYGCDGRLVDWKELTVNCPRRANDRIAFHDICGACFADLARHACQYVARCCPRHGANRLSSLQQQRNFDQRSLTNGYSSTRHPRVSRYGQASVRGNLVLADPVARGRVAADRTAYLRYGSSILNPAPQVYALRRWSANSVTVAVFATVSPRRPKYFRVEVEGGEVRKLMHYWIPQLGEMRRNPILAHPGAHRPSVLPADFGIDDDLDAYRQHALPGAMQ
jgi:hypothetical protein